MYICVSKGEPPRLHAIRKGQHVSAFHSPRIFPIQSPLMKEKAASDSDGTGAGRY